MSEEVTCCVNELFSCISTCRKMEIGTVQRVAVVTARIKSRRLKELWRENGHGVSLQLANHLWVCNVLWCMLYFNVKLWFFYTPIFCKKSTCSELMNLFSATILNALCSLSNWGWRYFDWHYRVVLFPNLSVHNAPQAKMYTCQACFSNWRKAYYHQHYRWKQEVMLQQFWT